MKKILLLGLIAVLMLLPIACDKNSSNEDAQPTQEQEMSTEDQRKLLSNYEYYLKQLDEDITKIDLAYDEARKSLTDKKEVNDEIYRLFNDFLDDCIFATKRLDEFDSDLIHVMIRGENPNILPNLESVFKIFDGKVTVGMAEYNKLFSRVYNRLMDFNRENHFNNLADSIVDCENYIKNYPKYEQEVKKATTELNVSIKWYISKNFSGTPMFDWETLKLMDSPKASIEKFISQNLNSDYYDLIKEYYTLLEESDFMINADFLNYLSDNGFDNAAYQTLYDNYYEYTDNEVYKKYKDYIQVPKGYAIVEAFEADIDGDGIDEGIFGIGKKYDRYEYEAFEVVVAREENGQIKEIDRIGDLGRGYNVIQVDLAMLKDLGNKIYLLVTNDDAMRGFSLLGLQNDKLVVEEYRASAVGAGMDMLTDPDKDFISDGFTQERWSYDVFNYYVTREYRILDGKFTLIKNEIDVEEYPKDAIEVIKQYLILNHLKYGKEQNVDTRLEALCHSRFNIDIDLNKSALMDISVDTKGDKAVGYARISLDNVAAGDFVFNLSLENDKWHIDDFELNKNFLSVGEDVIADNILGIIIKNPSEELLSKVVGVRKESIDEEDLNNKVIFIPKYNSAKFELVKLSSQDDKINERKVYDIQLGKDEAIILETTLPDGEPTHKIKINTNGYDSEYFITKNGKEGDKDIEYIMFKELY